MKDEFLQCQFIEIEAIQIFFKDRRFFQGESRFMRSIKTSSCRTLEKNVRTLEVMRIDDRLYVKYNTGTGGEVVFTFYDHDIRYYVIEE